MIEFRCRSCRSKLAVPNRKAGREGSCPSCGAPITVPTLITFTCPDCRATLGVVDYKAGRQGRCPNCGAAISAPVPPGAAAQPEPHEAIEAAPGDSAGSIAAAIQAMEAADWTSPPTAAAESALHEQPHLPAEPAEEVRPAPVEALAAAPVGRLDADSDRPEAPAAAAGELGVVALQTAAPPVEAPAAEDDRPQLSPGPGGAAAPGLARPELPAGPQAATGRTPAPEPKRPADLAGPGGQSVVKVSVPPWRPQRKVSVLGLVALILGILAAPTCWIPAVNVIGMPLGVLGLLLGLAGLLLALVRRNRGLRMPIAGSVVSGVALMVGIVTNVVFSRTVGQTAARISRAVEDSGALGRRGPAGPEPDQLASRALSLIGAEYLGQEDTDLGVRLRFRLSNHSGRAVKAFKGGILIYDQLGSQLDGLEVACDKPLGKGGSMVRSGIWPMAGSETLKLLKASPAEVRLRFLVAEVTYADGTREEPE